MRDVLRGALGPVRVASLLQLAENEMLTGRLTIDGVGDITALQGRVVGATHRDLTGTIALYELFLYQEGDFRFSLDPSVRGEALGPLLALILEGCRLADEWERLAPLYLKPTRPLPTPEPGPAAKVLSRLDGRRSVADAAAGLPRVRVVDPLLQLCETGLLVETDPPQGGQKTGRAPTPAPAQPRGADLPTDYFAAMDLGRKHLREGQYAEAKSAFEAALKARPNDRVAAQNLKRVAEALGSAPATSTAFTWFRRA
jgi:tetratricopeptide (TPR) repeat protein